MLQFVNLSGASGGKDLETRTRVRSQAMRDFRRRQREERESLKSSKKSSPASRERSASPAWLYRERGTSTGSESTRNLSKSRSRRTRSTKSMPTMLQKDCESTFQAIQPTPHVTTSQDLAVVSAMGEWQYDASSMGPLSAPELQYWYQGSSREPSPSFLLQEPSTWGLETEDPFESPAQLQQMMTFCRSYVHWLRPGVETAVAGNVLGQAWDKSKCRMLLAACCLASVGHLDAVQPNRPGGNYELYKARVLRDIGERMKSPERATSDETIGALACLLSFEMSRCSSEASLHLQGLASIVKLKNEKDPTPPGSGIPMMLSILDLLHAALFDAQPILDEAHATILRSPTAPRSATRYAALLVAEQEDFLVGGASPYTETLAGFITLMQYGSACVKEEMLEDASSDAVSKFQASLENFGRTSCVARQEALDAKDLGRCCFHVWSIVFNLIARRVPRRHGRNQWHAAQIFDAVRRVKLSTWHSIPYLRLFVLLTGGVSTSDPGAKSFFKAELVRSTYQMGADEWPRMEAFLLRVIQMRILERPERLSTPRIEMDAPMVPAAAQGFAQDYFGSSDDRPVPTTQAVDPNVWDGTLSPFSHPVSARSAQDLPPQQANYENSNLNIRFQHS